MAPGTGGAEAEMGLHLLLGAMDAALIKLACPHCTKVQLRAREPAGHNYRCKQCHKLFSREDGEQAYREHKR